MILLSVMIIGGVAASRLPLAFLPQVDFPFIGIRIPYPNSNPTQIEKDIIKPVEEILSTLSGVKKLSSESSADAAEINMEFDWGHDIDVVRMQVSEKMDQVRSSLPAGIGDILIFSFSSSDIPVVQARVAAEGVDLSKNYDLLEARIANRIRRVPGVARVEMNGVAPREISIDLIMDKVKEHQVDVSSLIERLQGASNNIVLGQVSDGGMRYTARAVGAFTSVEAIESLVINDRGLKLSDIAEIRYEEPVIEFGRHLEGKQAVAVEVFKESTANTVNVVRAVHKVIKEDINNDAVLQGINLFVWDDQAKMITDGLKGLTEAGLAGGLLAVLILYFFLRRIDSTMIVSSSIPFSIIAACGVMYFMGKTLNILSMMGLMLGVGMLVDNSIVVLESIDRRHRAGEDAKTAALNGANGVALAVVTSTMTSVIVFLPLILGANTELTIWLGEVGVAITLAMGCSIISALMLIPLASALFLKKRAPKRIRSVEWLEERYARVLGWTLRHKWKTAGLIVAVFIVGIMLPIPLKLVKTAQFAAQKNDRIWLSYDFKDFFYKSDAERAVTQIEEYLRKNKDEFQVKGLYSFYGDNNAMTVITLTRDNMGEEQIKELRKKIREKLPEVPGARVFFHEDAEEGGSTTYFAVKFFGQDSGVLQKFAEEAERRLDTIDGIEDINTGLNKARREVQVTVDRTKALKLGMTAQDISDIFAFTLGGMRLRRFNAGEHEVETWLALRLEDRENAEDLKNLQIRGPGGNDFKLGDIAQFEIVRRADNINRENRKVRSAVRASYEGKDWKKTREQITALMDAFEMPPGYTWSWDDRILEQDTQGKAMAVNYLLALLLVYIVMASLFESLAQPFAILFSIPFMMPGVFYLLAVTRTPFNLMAQIGILILMGIVVNNGIVLLDHVNQLRRSGMGREEAILQGGRDRLRAILMTASTTTLALLPLAVGGTAVGGLFYYPLARTVIGGLISSTFLTLIVLPYLDLIVEMLANWFRGLWSRSAPKAPEAEPEAVTA